MGKQPYMSFFRIMFLKDFLEKTKEKTNHLAFVSIHSDMISGRFSIRIFVQHTAVIIN